MLEDQQSPLTQSQLENTAPNTVLLQFVTSGTWWMMETEFENNTKEENPCF